MKVIDVTEEVLEEVEIYEKNGFFTQLRIDKASIPEGLYCYELRFGDDDSYPAVLEETVTVNYFGAVLFTDKMDLGESGKLLLSYEDFAYTGEQRSLAEFLMQGRCEYFTSPQNLVEFLDQNDMLLHMTEREAELLLLYVEGHGFLLGHDGDVICRGDQCYSGDAVVKWEPYSLDDVIDNVCEWNYELKIEAQRARENPDNFVDFVNKDSRYKSLCKDEMVLDQLFDRTKYGKEIQTLAERLADEFIQNLQIEGIEKSVKTLTQKIHVPEDKNDYETEQEKGRAR